MQEILVSRGKSLELLRPDPNTGKVHTLYTVEVFGIVRSLMAFRLTGGTKGDSASLELDFFLLLFLSLGLTMGGHGAMWAKSSGLALKPRKPGSTTVQGLPSNYIVVGSDSGRIVILEYIPAKNVLEKVHQETVVCVGAIEKQKLVYIMNRDAEARLTISSPLEAHKSNTLVYHTVGVDVGFENPMFACLEIDYEVKDSTIESSKTLNPRIFVRIRKQTQTPQVRQRTRLNRLSLSMSLTWGLTTWCANIASPSRNTQTFWFSVPGGNDGPSGVLICSENYLTYKNLGDQHDIRCPIPRRRNDLDDPERGMIFVCSATHKTKSMFFFLAQTEQGDIFKITLETDEDMCISLPPSYLYQIAHLGDDDDEPEFSSAMPLEEGDTFFFAPRPLRNLVLVDELDSLSPILACQVADLALKFSKFRCDLTLHSPLTANEDTPQLYMLCGRGPRSTVRVLRHGLEVSEMAVSELPGNPNAVWTVKRRADEEFDAYIIVSFVNATLVLSIGETVEEVTDSGFLGTTPTLSCSALGEEALMQIYPDGIRHIRADKRINEWKTPGKKTIVKCAVNQRQVVIALTGGELVYFEMDPTGQLNEYTERKEMPSEAVCMALANVPAGEQRSRFLAVGLADNTVRIISLDPSDCLSPLSMQALPAAPESLCIVEMGAGDTGPDGEPGKQGILYLNIGLQNGVLLRTVLDQVTGDLADTRTRYLGSRPVKLFRIHMQGSEAVLAMSSRSWLSYYYQNRFHLTPLSYESLEYASGFSSEQCPEGIVAISTNTLRILASGETGGSLQPDLKH
ncbi:unnamed protein product [Timema podura]|uniref:Splicing factor 3B subunit 3 n=1 Tax=Timema podura TaxID=61482 RepID=A0ABN7NRA1_TIMPD|nr:unnamed protein product [Timema podura]